VTRPASGVRAVALWMAWSALCDHVGRAHVMFTEEGLQGGAACELRRFERGPAAQEVAKERRLFVVKPR
jgi:hypothetical protein